MESWFLREDVGRQIHSVFWPEEATPFLERLFASSSLLSKLVVCSKLGSSKCWLLSDWTRILQQNLFLIWVSPSPNGPMRQISVLGARTDEIQELMFLQRWEKGSCLLASWSILTLPKFNVESKNIWESSSLSAYEMTHAARRCHPTSCSYTNFLHKLHVFYYLEMFCWNHDSAYVCLYMFDAWEKPGILSRNPSQWLSGSPWRNDKTME